VAYASSLMAAVNAMQKGMRRPVATGNLLLCGVPAREAVQSFNAETLMSQQQVTQPN
jgi:hypothetical protein